LLPASVYSNGSIAFNTNPGSIINATILIAIPQLELNPNIPAAVASAVTGGANGSGGVGYLVNDTGTITTTNGGTAATYKVTGVSGTAVTTVSITAAGSYTVDATHGLPASPAATVATSGVGTGLTLTLTPVDNSAQGFSTPPILTSSGALARAPDSISVPLANCANPSLLTIGTPAAPTSYPVWQNLVLVDDGTANNILVEARNSASGKPYTVAIKSGVPTFLNSTNVWAQSVAGKYSSVWNAATFATAFNNTNGLSTTPPAMPTFNRLQIGTQSGGAPFNGTISRVVVACGQSLLNQ
jgi:hypothetical protein